MFRFRFALFTLIAALASTGVYAQQPSESRTPSIKVSQAAGKWSTAGKKKIVTLNASDLAAAVQAGEVTWRMVPPSDKDPLVRSGDASAPRLPMARQSLSIGRSEQSKSPPMSKTRSDRA